MNTINKLLLDILGDFTEHNRQDFHLVIIKSFTDTVII